MNEHDRLWRGEPRADRPQRRGRRVAAVLTIIASVAFAGYPAVADEDDAEFRNTNNVVLVTNERDGSWKTRARQSVAQESGPTVANENVALARASCTDCRTVAVAIQAIVVEGAVTDFRPGNAAVAANVECERCQTFAYARQEVLYAEGRVRIGEAAKERIGAIKAQMKWVADSDIPFDQMIGDLDALVVELVEVLQTEIEQWGPRATERSDRKVERDDD